MKVNGFRTALLSAGRVYPNGRLRPALLAVLLAVLGLAQPIEVQAQRSAQPPADRTLSGPRKGGAGLQLPQRENPRGQTPRSQTNPGRPATPWAEDEATRPQRAERAPRTRRMEGTPLLKPGQRYRGERVELAWNLDLEPVAFGEGQTGPRPSFLGARRGAKQGLPWYRVELDAQGSGLDVRLTDAVWEALPEAQQQALEGLEWPNAVELEAWTQEVARARYGVVFFLPMRRNPATGRIERLRSFRLETRDIGTAATGQQRFAGGGTTGPGKAYHRAADQSVLASGTWFKIAVPSTGVYRIDYAFLQGLGLDPASIDPARLALFGNGGGMVPEDNDQPRIDDLAEVATLLQDGGDGSFDEGDALLFYARDPDRHRFDGGRFRQVHHLYSERTVFFLTPDQGSGLRVPTVSEPAAAEDVVVNSFDHVAWLEEDKESLLSSGREWYGDFFDAFTPQRSYTFAVPDRIVSEPVFTEARFAARSAVSSTPFEVRINGSNVISTSLGQITIGFEVLYASTKTVSDESVQSGGNLNVDVIASPDASARGWLDYLLINARRSLRMPSAGALSFRDMRSLAEGAVARFDLANASGATVWEVSDPVRPRQRALASGGSLSFKAPVDSLREYIAWRNSDVVPSNAIEVLGPVANQNLHARMLAFPDYVVVSHPLFLDEARRLAAFHADQNGYDTLVASTVAVYNEFAGGVQDPSGIRDFVRLGYARASGEDQLPRYLCLVGDASFDFKNIKFDATVNQNFVPSFQTINSEHPIFSTNTDDYFGFLDQGDGGSTINADTMGIDIGVGRLPVKTVQEARTVVDKILHYASSASLGAWRNTITFVADDEDGDTHRRQADKMAQELVAGPHPVYNVDKIYLDAYQQVSASGGERYPAAREAINNRMFAGTFVMNFLGHGSEESWTKERVLGEVDIEQWTNLDKLALFITATCSFSRYDNPAQTSAGELILLQPEGGGIALITTVRLVFSGSNEDINRALWRNIFELLPDGSRPTLGDLVRIAKNELTGGAFISDGNNNRKFALLGDPGLTLAYPDYRVVTNTVNGLSPAGGVSDTLKALSLVRVEGEVQNASGERLEGFNGVVSPTIFDKASVLQTLSNDGAVSPVRQFELQKNIIYRGNASVTDGRFSFEFIVPKDISYSLGKGKISYYARAGEEDAHGFDTTVVVGGAADSIAADDQGPEVRIFLGDEDFAFGGITNESPTLLVKLEDQSGINTVGNGIGHDITAVINEAESDAIVLNDFYEAELDDFRRGTVTYLLQDLEPGRYRLQVGAWDVHNNPGEGYTEFVVAESAELALSQVLNYPNPFTDRTEFLFEHNRPGEPMRVTVEIFSVSGKRIKTLVQDVVTDGFRVNGIEWDGRDAFGDTIGRGVYVYKVSVRSQLDPSLKATAFQKLVMLN